MAATRVVVHGRVQGVSFRVETRRAARQRGVTGWVRNRADGSVQAHLEGDADAVAAVERWMTEEGPPGAQVERLEREDVPVEGFHGFEVRG